MLFATCYIGEQEHLDRYQRYLDYYSSKMSRLGVDKIILIDDGSPKEWLVKLGLPVYEITVEKMPDKVKLPKQVPENMCIFTFPKNFGRPVLTMIPGWWRSFTFAAMVGVRYNLDKLIHIEADAFVLSEKMFRWLKNTNDTWSSPYTNRYWYAETAIQIIPRKSFPHLFQFWQMGKEYWYKNGYSNMQYIPELILPIENVVKNEFYGDRWGEDWWHENIPMNADYTVNMGAITEGAMKYTSIYNSKCEDFFKRVGLWK